jgi:hypothetical protein
MSAEQEKGIKRRDAGQVFDCEGNKLSRRFVCRGKGRDKSSATGIWIRFAHSLISRVNTGKIYEGTYETTI